MEKAECKTALIAGYLLPWEKNEKMKNNNIHLSICLSLPNIKTYTGKAESSKVGYL